MKKRDRLAIAIKPVVEQLETRRLLATQLISGTVGDDTILIRTDPNDASAIEVTINGSTSSVPVTFDTIDVQPLTGNDTVTIQALPNGINTVTLEDTGGNDNVDASGPAATVNETLSAGDGDDTIV